MMAQDTRPWVRTHERPGVWHLYDDGHFERAVCGHPPIPGMPYVAEVLSSELGGNVCLECFASILPPIIPSD